MLRKAAKEVSQKLGVPMTWEPLELALFEYDAHKAPLNDSDALVAHTHCERQGRCMLGIPQARHTLNKTLFKKVLQNAGVTLLPKCKVIQIATTPGGYEVTYEDRFTGHGTQKQSAPMLFLAGGVLGSTEILLRSARENTLPLSQTLGTKFSTNGDFGAFAYKTINKKTGRPLPVSTTKGPINTSHVTLNFNGRFIKIEDCGVPALFAEYVSKGLEILDRAGASPNFFQLMKGIWTPISLSI